MKLNYKNLPDFLEKELFCQKNEYDELKRSFIDHKEELYAFFYDFSVFYIEKRNNTTIRSSVHLILLSMLENGNNEVQELLFFWFLEHLGKSGEWYDEIKSNLPKKIQECLQEIDNFRNGK